MISQTSNAHSLRNTTAGNPSVKALVVRVLTLQSIWLERRALKSMTHQQLDDIGQSRQTALSEADRPAWDAPSRWLL